MAIPVLLILAVLWAAVLIPPLLRARTEGGGADSIGDFRYRLGVLSKTGGYGFRRASSPLRPVAPLVGRPLAVAPNPAVGHVGMTPAQQRRRDVFVTLLSIVGGSFVLAALSGVQMMWYLHVLADVLLAMYVALLVRIKHTSVERQVKVRYLPHPAAPQLATLRRTASS